MWDNTFDKVRLELTNLHTLLKKYTTLFKKVEKQEPDDVELMALASILHSFYMGFENIFKRIATEIDGGFRKTDSWHIDLLESMNMSKNKRKSVISRNTSKKLRYYLSFRHVFRSNYSYDINWLKMKPLVHQTKEILSLVEKELEAFISNPVS